ncbi:caspase family protein [Oryzomonas rubra]|uniref:Caspase family protein n=1 Tax=Oryzomonas rubra TaxID=2509454 RepID=A0A5A9XPA6_9BACT|nr:caspase family protein [Oryzomonas rubra]KAA0894088.1 caspase family protein [Oryzomonas rubra]
MTITQYDLKYGASRALIVGINNYNIASPLGYAVSDAEAISVLLVEKFGFTDSDIEILLDDQATKTRILAEYLKWANHGTSADDRLLFFFAGHGYTIPSRRGEVGYLVPHDGNPDDLSTLIRWDELTRNAELFKSKHMLFIMDACYGGLALTRSPMPGTMRFLKDMLLRYSRQVLTAGKADEVVADSGGPIPDHSIFTGHLIDALNGKAATRDGIITANGVMAYVYEKVSRDQHSHQTPHYGYLEGDGDFIFHAPGLTDLINDEIEDSDILISIPSSGVADLPQVARGINELAKDYLSEGRHRIRLHDLVATEVRRALAQTSDDSFPVQGGNFSGEEFIERLHRYEASVDTLADLVTSISYWGTSEHVSTLKLPFAQFAGRLESQNGLVVWLALRWYPICLLAYSSGIAAVASSHYDYLYSVFMTNVTSRRLDSSCELVLALGDFIAESHNTFKALPGHERNYTPRSEYFFKLLQPKLDDLLYLGNDYEATFDRFEILLGLVHADLEIEKHHSAWGPIGRFGWKLRSRMGGSNPYQVLLDEAGKLKDSWPPLRAGFFGGNYTRFETVANQFSQLLGELRPY